MKTDYTNNRQRDINHTVLASTSIKTAEEIMLSVANKHSYESWGEMMYDIHEHSQVEYTKEAMEEYTAQSKPTPSSTEPTEATLIACTCGKKSGYCGSECEKDISSSTAQNTPRTVSEYEKLGMEKYEHELLHPISPSAIEIAKGWIIDRFGGEEDIIALASEIEEFAKNYSKSTSLSTEPSTVDKTTLQEGLRELIKWVEDAEKVHGYGNKIFTTQGILTKANEILTKK